MYSRDHAITSLAIGVVGAVALSLPIPDWAAMAYAIALGVGIDVDHFLVARVRTGEWDALRRCLRDPRLAFFDQTAIFHPDAVTPLSRLLSHVVIAGALVGALALVAPSLAVFTALVLYVHLLADLLWDTVLKPEAVRRAEETVPETDGSTG